MPDSQQQQTSKSNGAADSSSTTATKKTAELDARLAEQSFAVHMQFGGEYMDENPITGKPGDFHLSSTGRKPPEISKLQIPAAPTAAQNPTGANANSKGKDGAEKGGGSGTPKTPQTPTGGLSSKLKRRKSKGGGGSGGGAATPTSS